MLLEFFHVFLEFWRRGWSLEISRGGLATPSTRFRWRTSPQTHAPADAGLADAGEESGILIFEEKGIRL